MATNNALNITDAGIVSYDGSGTFSAETNPLAVNKGGTGVASVTAYAVLCGSTSGSGSLQSVASLGSSGDILTSNGAGSLPSFQTPSSGSGYLTWELRTSNQNPADSTSYYLGSASTWSTSLYAAHKFFVPSSITITNVYGHIRVGGTTASSGTPTIYLRKNDTTNTSLTTSNWNAALVTFNATISVSMSAGDYFSIYTTTPTWATNPTTVSINCTIIGS